MSYGSNQSAPSRRWLAVTPHNTNDIGVGARGLYVGGGGDVSLIDDSGTTVTFFGVAAGAILPIAPTRVRVTGTTATNIIALY